jgi:hypothetical protein
MLTTTNFCRQVQEKYLSCKLKPQLWKLQAYNDTDPLIYSDPGLFFSDWMRCERLRQQKAAEDRIARKALKKQMKRRRRQRLEEYRQLLERELEARALYMQQQALSQLQLEQQANMEAEVPSAEQDEVSQHYLYAYRQIVKWLICMIMIIRLRMVRLRMVRLRMASSMKAKTYPH